MTRWLAAARLVLWLERLWPHLVALASLAAVFAALALFDVLPRLPVWLHAAVLALFALAAAALVTALVRVPPPDAGHAARRLERDSALPHQPLSVLADHPATAATPLAAVLWREHRRRMELALARPRLDFPRSDMAARDPLGWRAAALLLLVVALAGGGGDADARLRRALVPAVPWPGLSPTRIDVWITPPAYTAVAPALLRPDQDTVAVPAGSTALAVLGGGWGGESLVLDGHDAAFAATGDGSRRAEMEIGQSGRLAVRQWGRTLAHWTIRAVADAVPSVDFAEPPEDAGRGRLRLSVAASDDYGLARLWLEIRRAGLDDGGPPLTVDLPLAASRPRSADLTSWHDLSAHPWAGLPVTVRAVAEDGRGQTGASDWLAMELPQRHFSHPGARIVADQRRLLTQPAVRVLDVMAALDGVSADRALFGDDLLSFLALRVARHALADDGADLDDVQDVLWNAALRIEEGDLAAAERTLEQARHDLQQAIQSAAPASRIEALVDAFQAALNRWLQAMAAGTAGDAAAPTPLDRVIDGEDLAGMMQSLRDLARNGARDALAALMRDVTALLQSVRPGETGNDAGPALDALSALREVMHRQQNLLDYSHRQAQSPAGPAGHAAASGQDAVRRSLTEAASGLERGLGQRPPGLDEAAQAMQVAAEALRRDDWTTAAGHQGQALDLLRQSARMAQDGMAAGPGSPRRPDPLGRPAAGPADDGATRIPHRAELNRSQQILDELRRRSGDGSRSQGERDYLHRLLRQF
jgi:uncharacterized protein (TIGR02302 family)